MHLQRLGKFLTALNCTDDESADLQTRGFKFDDALRKFVAPYNEDTLHEVASLPGVTLDDLLFAFLQPCDQYKDRPRIILPSKRSDPPMEHQQLWNTLLLEQGRFLLRGDTGTGKSKPTVDVASHLMRIGRVNICLIVTETTPVEQWSNRHVPADTDYKCVALLGTKQERIAKLRAGLANGARFFVINYDGFKVIKDELRKVLNSESILILDESQNVKRHVSEIFKAVYDTIWENGIRWVWLLSATPVTQSPEDIFGQAAIVDKRLFGAPSDHYRFKASYLISVPSGGPGGTVSIGYKNMQEFMPRLHSMMDSVRKSVLNLPPAFYEVLDFDLPPKLRSLYDDYVKKHGVLQLPGADEPLFIAEHPLTEAAKARQIVSNYIYKKTLYDPDDPERELDAPVTEIITLFPELVNNDKMAYITDEGKKTGDSSIIIYQHKADRLLIERALIEADRTYVRVDGDVDPKLRWPLMEQFQNRQVQYFVGQERSIRTGIELTQAKVVYYYNNGYSVNNRIQGEGRAYRKGVEHSVLFIDLRWKRTIEVYMYHALQKKWDICRSLVEGENLDKIMLGEIWL